MLKDEKSKTMDPERRKALQNLLDQHLELQRYIHIMSNKSNVHIFLALNNARSYYPFISYIARIHNRLFPCIKERSWLLKLCSFA